jgi:D-xylose transport system permease protein
MPRDPLRRVGAGFGALSETRFGALIPVLLALLAIWVFFGLTEPAFVSPRNFYFLFMQSAVVGTIAIGITVVLLIGDIDLSVAATAGVCAAVLAVLVTNEGVPAPLAILVVLGVGILLSSAQGLIIAFVRIPSFVVTLAGLLAFQGLMLKILGIQGALNVREPSIRDLTTVTLSPELGWALAIATVAAFAIGVWRTQRRRSRLGLEQDPVVGSVGKVVFFAVLAGAGVAILNAYRGVPVLVVLLLGITAILGWVTTSTPFGRSLFAVGGNTESARRVGISITWTRVAAFSIVGLMAAVAGIVGASRYASVSYNAFAGGPLLLEAIGAAVIGGTSLFGGRGSVWNAILGALVIGSLGNGLDLRGASAADKFILSGAVLLLAVTIDAISRRNATQTR